MSANLVQARIGTTLAGRWRLDAVIGHGGLATVYAARDERGAPVAVKLLDPNLRAYLSEQPHLRAQFMVERDVADRVRHPGMVQVLADGEADDGSPFIVMEQLDGLDVGALLDKLGTLAVEPVAALLLQLLDLLRATHELAIIHHDIKPSNLFVTRDGIVKLLDFGVSSMTRREVERPASITSTGALLMGTPQFCAPEVCQGRSDARRDPRADLWSVGATAFTALAGRTVHVGESSMALVYRSATHPAPPLAQVAPHVPGPMASVIDRALAFEPSQRWPGAEAMADALRRAWHAMKRPEEPGPALLVAVLA